MENLQETDKLDRSDMSDLGWKEVTQYKLMEYFAFRQKKMFLGDR